MKKIRGYVFSRSFLSEKAPQQVQNMAIRDYCSKHNLKYFLSEVEYAMENCYFALNGLIDKLTVFDGIVLYSMFQLPENIDDRHEIYKKIINKKKELHFAIESLSIEKEDDLKRIENFWQVKSCLMNPKNYWYFK